MAPIACVHTLCTRQGVNSRKFRQPVGYSRKVLFCWVKLTNYRKNASRNAFQAIRLDNCGTGGRWFEPTQLYQRIQWRHFRRNIDLMFSFGWPCFGWQQTHALRCAVPSLAQHRSDTLADWCIPTMGGAENAHHSYKLGSGGGFKPSFLKSGPPARLKRARMIVNAVVMWRSAFAWRLNCAATPVS